MPLNKRLFTTALILLLLFLFNPLQTIAQMITDDFSDGNFTQNPAWTGTTQKFTINSSFQLQLNDTEAGNAWLSTAYGLSGSIEWRFWIRLNFSPSANNFSDVFLVSNNPNLNEPLNGYFLRFGENLANDAIELFKKQGASITSVCRGTPGLIANAFAISVKVVRNPQGQWKIFADPGNVGLYQSEATGTDNTFVPGGFFGFYCQYTVSNIKNFFFDNVYVGPEIIDNVPPQLQSVTATSSSSLKLVFNEVLDQQTALNIANYRVDNNIGNPVSAQAGTNPAQILLQFGNTFGNGVSHNLTIENIKDPAGNLMPVTQISFLFYQPKPFDVVISEIMADPTPVVALPAHEYLEFYNTTAFPIKLNGWIFQHGTTQRQLPDVEISPNGYLILCNYLAINELQTYGPAMVIEGLSTTALTNAGATISIYDAQGILMHSVSYSDEWYGSTAKKDGGWSLEQIDPLNPCGESKNWKASIALSGGTPGRQNSVKATNPDTEPPVIDRIVIMDSRSITVYFTEKMARATLNNLGAYSVDQNVGYPISVIAHEPRFDAVTLSFSSVFVAHIIYTLGIVQQLSDCAGNSLALNSSNRFAIPQAAAPGDVVINEILFNPPAGCEDYLEIYNKSQKVVDLRQLRLSSQDTILQQLTSLQQIAPIGYLLFPGDYLLLTTSPEQVKKNYMTINPGGFLKMLSFPQFSNAGGIAVLSDPNEVIIDRLVYFESMHFALLNTYKGVALERIDFNRPASDKTNWHSASSNVGYGTPAYRNSQYLAIVPADNVFSLSPDIFSPDNDGYNDVLSISYEMPEPGFVATIVIYDVNGRLIRRLVQGQLLGTTGTYSWNGITDNNEKAPIGYYLVLIETFDLKGNVKQYKKTTVLGGRL
ncbi:MAG: lamin tail domain-containing protein [Bacteroidales bacterium]|nr:lamin tail domain-containing protein [Bacteroidales bacterium]MDZ4205364.1 lamin tail domain-containing protein [Bacteroidales bacterium]